jgi:hypothetical protein
VVSGTWSGWFRRKKGRDEWTEPTPPALPIGPQQPESQPATDPIDGEATRPEPAPLPHPPHQDEPPVEPEAIEPGDHPAGEADPDVPETAAVEGNAVHTVRDLLVRGHLARAAAADPHGRLAALVAAIAAGETILAELGLNETRAVAADGVLRGVMLAPNEGARHLVVIFGADDGGFVVPLALAGPKRQHLLFVQDRQHCLALLGVDRLGDSYDACLANILRIRKHLGARLVYCLGAGGGMYSALRYGLDLGADGVAALGTLTRLQQAADLPGKRTARRSRLLLQMADRLGSDLEQAYAAAAKPPRLALCRSVGKDTDEGAVADPPPDLFAGVTDRAFLDAPPGTRRRLLAWADASGRLRLLLGMAMGVPQKRRALPTDKPDALEPAG